MLGEVAAPTPLRRRLRVGYRGGSAAGLPDLPDSFTFSGIGMFSFRLWKFFAMTLPYGSRSKSVRMMLKINHLYLPKRAYNSNEKHLA